MESDRFDRLARRLQEGVSRRGFGTVLAGGLSAFALAGGPRVEGKKKKKKKKKPSCNRCGGVCCDAGNVCVIRGPLGEQCVPEVRTCAREDDNCSASNRETGGLWCNSDKNCDCHVTVSGEVACLAFTSPTACGNCTEDADCTGQYGAGARCVQSGSGCTSTGCTSGFCKRACPA